MDSITSKGGARRGFLRRGVRLGAGAGLAALLGGWSNATRAAATQLRDTTLRVGTYKGGDASYFTEAGVATIPYKTALAEFAAGNLIVEALAADSLDFGSMSEIPPIFAAAGGAPLRVIAVLRGDVNNQVVLVPKNSPITDPAQFKGKRIGYARSTTSHYFLLQLLKENGLGFKDIQPVALPPQDAFAAFKSGQLDAWVIYGLVVELAKSQEGARVLRTADGYLSGNYVISTSAKAIADPLKHAAIGDYLQRVAKVYDWINRNPQPWAAKSGRIAGVPPQFFLSQASQRSQPYKLTAVDDAAIKSQQQVADVFADAGLLARRVDVKPIWDRSFAKYLA
jgi:sulfonate transport system substrate-binding protein